MVIRGAHSFFRQTGGKEQCIKINLLSTLSHQQIMVVNPRVFP